jgi:hypothetical protein
VSRAGRALFAILIVAATPRVANADLGEDAARLTTAWKATGKVQRLAPRLAERAAPVVIFLPAELASPSSGVCTSVAILGPTSTHFTARAVGPAASDDSDDWPQPSLAGMVQLTRCGQRRTPLSTVLIEMRSPRAVLETIAVEARAAVRPAIDVLPQRNPGPIAPIGGSEPRALPPPMAQRLASAAVRLAREGTRDVRRDVIQSSPRGTGKFPIVVEAGCHRFDFFAEPARENADDVALAVEPELDAAASLVAVDQGDGLDAAVTLCAGDRSQVSLDYGGAPAGSSVHVLAAAWPLPPGLPEAWGPTGRARVAAVLRRHSVRIAGAPIDQALGVQGPTLMPVAVEPGACYVATLVAVRGAPQALALAAVAGNLRAQNHGGLGGEGTLVSFCARARESVLFEADSRGNGLFWLFALFQNGRVAIGEERD